MWWACKQHRVYFPCSHNCHRRTCSLALEFQREAFNTAATTRYNSFYSWLYYVRKTTNICPIHKCTFHAPSNRTKTIIFYCTPTHPDLFPTIKPIPYQCSVTGRFWASLHLTRPPFPDDLSQQSTLSPAIWPYTIVHTITRLRLLRSYQCSGRNILVVCAHERGNRL